MKGISDKTVVKTKYGPLRVSKMLKMAEIIVPENTPLTEGTVLQLGKNMYVQDSRNEFVLLRHVVFAGMRVPVVVTLASSTTASVSDDIEYKLSDGTWVASKDLTMSSAALAYTCGCGATGALAVTGKTLGNGPVKMYELVTESGTFQLGCGAICR